MSARLSACALAALLVLTACGLSGAPPAAQRTPARSPSFAMPAGRVLFSQLGGDLYWSLPDGSHRTAITDDGPSGGWVGAIASPDGKLIAAEKALENESGSGLFLLDPQSQTSARLSLPNTFLDGYQWSPDGRYLAFGEIESGSSPVGSFVGAVGNVVLVDVVDESRAIVGPGTHPAFSPDGKRIGWAHTAGGIAVADLATGNVQLIVRLADLTRFSITNAPKGMGLIGGPQWSHDGKLIAYAAIEQGPVLDALQIIYVQDAVPGAPPKQWAIGKTGAYHHVADLRWSPTANILGYAFINAQPHYHWIGTIDPADPTLHEMYSSPDHFVDFSWSPDGQIILLQVDSGDRWLFLRPGVEGVLKEQRPGGWRPQWCLCGI